MSPLAEVSAPPGCAHCGQPVPAELRAGEGPQFCCAGCRTVHELLAGAGLDGFYSLARAEGAALAPAAPTDRSYEEMDAERFQQLYVHELPDGQRCVDLYLEGVHCGACVWLVERLARAAPGVTGSRLDLGRSLARVSWDPARTSLAQVARSLDRLGYAPHPYRGGRLEELRRAEDRQALGRIALAGALAGNVMLMAFALYGGFLAGMEARFEQLFRWGCLALTVPALLGPGQVFLRGGWASLRTRTLHMDLPIAIGLLAGTGWGAWNTWRGQGDVYFETVTILIFLLLVGRWLERRQQRRAVDAAELLHALQPSRARRREGDAWREVPLEALAPGDRVEVRAGEAIPADGVVAAGESHLDLSLLTGESRPVAVGPGQAVHAGTLNQGAPLEVVVDRTGEETRVGQLLLQVEEAARRKAPVVQLANALAGWFVLTVLGLAALTVALWWGRDPGAALDHAVALLIVTCPCALGLATPLALSVAMGRAARRGVLLKGGSALERLARPDRIWLDKTGTLTQGRCRLVRWEGEAGLQPLVLALEAGSAHPLARAFSEAWPELPPAQLAGPGRRTGPGLEGEEQDGSRLRFGAPAWVRTAAPGEPAWVGPFLAEAVAEGLTPLLLSRGGQVVAGAACGDPLRPEARATISRLRQRGLEVGILSGDDPQLVRAVGRQLGLDEDACLGGLLPEDKLTRVEADAARGTVVMVGDGVNDAAALAAASVGVGVHGGAEATLAAADVFLTRADLAAIDELLQGASHTLGTIRRNLLLSLGYNVIGAGLAMAGLLNPLVAAVLMPFSSLTVIASSSRAGRNPWT